MKCLAVEVGIGTKSGAFSTTGISDREIDALFKPLEAKEIGIELTIENDSRRLDISSLFLVTERLWSTRVYVLADSPFANWLLAFDPYDEPDSPSMEAFAKVLR